MTHSPLCVVITQAAHPTLRAHLGQKISPAFLNALLAQTAEKMEKVSDSAPVRLDITFVSPRVGANHTRINGTAAILRSLWESGEKDLVGALLRSLLECSEDLKERSLTLFRMLPPSLEPETMKHVIAAWEDVVALEG